LKRKAIICDIDGTVADCRHRLHHVLPGGKRNWDRFFEGMVDDPVIKPVRDLVWHATTQGDWEEIALVFSSGRPETYRVETEVWLRAAGLPLDSFSSDRLYMRPANDTRPDHVVKREMLDRIRADGYEPFIVIDDRPSVVAMWRESGLVCLQAAPGEEPIPSTAVLTLMVGPSGAGKTRWLDLACLYAESAPEGSWVNLGIRGQHIVSSDEVRQDLCGNIRDQSRNQEVFAAVHSVAKARLRAGLPTVIDATHLRRKDRMTAAQLVPATNPVRYIVLNRPLEAKLRDGGWRLDVDGGRFMERHEQTFRSQLRDILAGDGLTNVKVYDLRGAA
jgi:hypothetical protein